MAIAVTGASGKLGRAVMREFQLAGKPVRGIDRVEGVGIVVADLRNPVETTMSLAQCEAVVHLAAWPTPHSASAGQVFTDNVAMASNVLFSAIELGIRRVVIASSQSVLGLAWASEVIEPDYLPVDEEHPCRPGDSYSLSKLVTEHLAKLLSDRGEIDAKVLRFPVIWDPDQFAEATASRMARPEQGAKSQWAYVDVRDAARATRLALESDACGYDVFNITAPQVFSSSSTELLLREWYPKLASVADPPAGQSACFDSRHARDALGFCCRYRWTAAGIEDTAPRG